MLTVEYRTRSGQWVEYRRYRTETNARKAMERLEGETHLTGEPEPRHTYSQPAGGVAHVGDIFHCMWGYSMTFNDFYEVVKTSPSGKTVTLRQLKTRVLERCPEGPGSIRIMPMLTGDDRFDGKPFQRRVRASRNSRHSCYVAVSSCQTAFLMEPEEYLNGWINDMYD